MSKKPGRPRKLPPETIHEIQLAWKERRKTQREMALEHNVHVQTIYNIVHERGPYGPPVVLIPPEPPTAQDSAPLAEAMMEYKGHTFYANQKGIRIE